MSFMPSETADVKHNENQAEKGWLSLAVEFDNALNGNKGNATWAEATKARNNDAAKDALPELSLFAIAGSEQSAARSMGEQVADARLDERIKNMNRSENVVPIMSGISQEKRAVAV